MQIGRLLVYTLSPSLPLHDRKEALEFVFDHKHIDILKESLSPGLEVSEKNPRFLWFVPLSHLRLVFHPETLCLSARAEAVAVPVRDAARSQRQPH